MMIDDRDRTGPTRIKVLGVGGGGSNAVSRMYRERLPGVDYIIVNTDAQATVNSDVPLKIRIGDQLTRGKGVGGDPDLGMRSAEESREELYEAVRDSDMVFIAGGMGGGTGTGDGSRPGPDLPRGGGIDRWYSNPPLQLRGRTAGSGG